MNVMLIVVLIASLVTAAEVEWNRVRGKVKLVDGKASKITVQNSEGDLLTVKVTDDVLILDGKEPKRLADVSIDEKIILVYSPKAVVKDAEEPAAGSVYTPVKR